jgi:hypothetical protein
LKELKGGGQPHVIGAIANVPCDVASKTLPQLPLQWHDDATMTIELKNKNQPTLKPYRTATIRPTIMLACSFKLLPLFSHPEGEGGKDNSVTFIEIRGVQVST